MAKIIVGVITFIGWVFLFYGFYKLFQAVYRRLTIKVGDIFYKERYSSKNPFIYQTYVDYYEIKQIKRGWLEYQSSEIFYRNDGENANYINFGDEKRKVRSNGYMNILSFTLLMIPNYKKLKRSEKNKKE